MNETKKNAFANELTDEALEDVSGGLFCMHASGPSRKPLLPLDQETEPEENA